MALRRALTAAALAAAALTLWACSHGEPFAHDPARADTARLAGNPAQITYSVADDRTAAWLPDGSGIVYSSERTDRSDHDRCLAVLPPGGGTIVRRVCDGDATRADSVDRYESPAVSADGRLAMLRVVAGLTERKGGRGGIVVTDWSRPGALRLVHPLDYPSPTGKLHGTAAHIAWLSSTRLVWLGQRLFYEGSTFLPDTFVTGLEVMRADLSESGATVQPVPGTEWASSVAPGPSAEEIFVTIAGDSRVYRVHVGTGERTVVYDAGEIVREVQVSGNMLVAIVGRSVVARVEPAQLNSLVQRDEGGDLLVVDLAGGEAQRIAHDDWLYRRPALSPDGRSVVVERAPFAPPVLQATSDYTALNHRPDLWLFRLQPAQ
jgi:hypothetical protein